MAVKPMTFDEAEDLERAEQACAEYYNGNEGFSSEVQDYLDFVFDNRPLCEPFEIR